MSTVAEPQSRLPSPALLGMIHTSARRDRSLLDSAVCWQAIYSRDSRFDGRFFVATASTGLYCRSVCPVPFAKPRNIVFFVCAAAAEAAGFKPCRRCRPQASPGTPAWLGTSAVVSRALRLIWEGALDKDGVDELAQRVGIGSRHLRRLFVQHLGASPIQIAGTHRVHFARKLIDETDLPLTQVALSAGFVSIRQFNHAVKLATGRAPRQLRQSREQIDSAPHQKGLIIRLPYRLPLNWSAMIRFLAERATFGVELATEERYARTIQTDGMTGTLAVRPDPVESRLIVTLELPDFQMLMPIVERIKRIFDLGADPLQIASSLSCDAQMQSLIESQPGLRVPGVWDGFELGVKTLLGEQLMAGGSRALLRMLVCSFGKPVETSVKGLTHLFPRPEVLANADLEGKIGLRAKRAASIRMFAGIVSRGQFTFEAPTTLEDTVSRLSAIPNLTLDSAQYIAMRAFGEPDAVPLGRLGLDSFGGSFTTADVRKGDPDRAERWRPWRAYAAMHIWAAKRMLAM